MEERVAKLAEKLGFTLVSSEKYPGLYDIVKDGYENQGATAEEIALWNLCLELSERANCKHEGIVITAEVSYCPACWRAFPIANPPLTEAEVKRAKELWAEKEKKA